MPATKQDPHRYLRAIFGAARAHGVTNEELHETIWVCWQQRSLKDLTQGQIMQLLDGLNGRGDQFSRGRRDAMNSHGRKHVTPDVHYLANERELQMLRDAAQLRGWDTATLNRFIERQIHQPAVRTLDDLNKILWALKSMNKRDGLWK